MLTDSAILVLAGGRSRRMGQDKARMPIHGSTLLAWQKQRLRSLGLPVYHSGPDGIPDGHPGFQGPLAGMAAAARAHPEVKCWVVVPVDMPGLEPDQLRPLLTSMADTGRPVAYRNAPLPLGWTIVDGVLDRLDAWLADPTGPRAIRDLHQAYQGLWLAELDDAEALSNLNTPEDWDRYCATLGISDGEHS